MSRASWALGTDEMEKAHQRRLDDLSRMLEQGDLDEARAMAEEAGQNMGRIEGELRRKSRPRVGDSGCASVVHGREPRQARNLAGEIEAGSPRRCPILEDLLSPQERRQLADLRAEQRRCGDGVARSARVRQRGQQPKADAPAIEQLGQQAGELLRRAQGHMQQSEGELGRLALRGAVASQGKRWSS